MFLPLLISPFSFHNLWRYSLSNVGIFVYHFYQKKIRMESRVHLLRKSEFYGYPSHMNMNMNKENANS